jgi:hypothetical protein
MQYLKLLGILPLILQLIKSAEGIVEGAKKGEVKKTFVMNVLTTIVNGLVSFQVIKDVEVAPILEVFGQLVDNSVDFLNTLGVLKTS